MWRPLPIREKKRGKKKALQVQASCGLFGRDTPGLVSGNPAFCVFEAQITEHSSQAYDQNDPWVGQTGGGSPLPSLGRRSDAATLVELEEMKTLHSFTLLFFFLCVNPRVRYAWEGQRQWPEDSLGDWDLSAV